MVAWAVSRHCHFSLNGLEQVVLVGPCATYILYFFIFFFDLGRFENGVGKKRKRYPSKASGVFYFCCSCVRLFDAVVVMCIDTV